MEKQESKSKWDELAREIGADVSPDVERREEAALAGVESPAAPIATGEATFGVARAAAEAGRGRLE